MKKKFFAISMAVAMIAAGTAYAAPEAADATAESAVEATADSEGESADSEAAEATAADEAADSSADSAGTESADGESSGDSSGDSSDGESSGAVGMANGANNEETAVIAAINGAEPTTNENYGSLEIAEGGELTASTISGVKIIGSSDESNGIFVSSEDDNAIFTFGGSEDYYEVEGVGSFNSVIDTFGTTTDEEVEMDRATSITVNGGILAIDNVYCRTNGYRSGTLYAMSSTHAADIVVKDSVLWTDGADGSFMPDFKIIVGSARNTLLLAGDVWAYNSTFISKDWGAFSHDMKLMRTSMWSVNSDFETYAGGYTLYALDCTDNYLYGCRMVSPEFGMFVMGHGGVYIYNAADADETALQFADGEDFSETVTEDGNGYVVGGVNAIVLHTMASANEPATIQLSDVTLSTMEDELVSNYGLDMNFDLDSYLTNYARYGEAWFYIYNVKGAVITTRSHAANIDINEGTVTKSAKGVLVQTGLEIDEQAGDVWHDSTDSDPMYDIYMNINAPAEGDILSEDYQRDFYITVNSEYTGDIVNGTIVSWNNIWTKESMAAMLEDAGNTDLFELTDEAVANIRSILVREEDTTGWTEELGVRITIAEGGVWNVEEESSVRTLTITEGAAVNAAEMYVGCAQGEDGFLDASTGTLTEIAAGTYENVVLVAAN